MKRRGWRSTSSLDRLDGVVRGMLDEVKVYKSAKRRVARVARCIDCSHKETTVCVSLKYLSLISFVHCRAAVLPTTQVRLYRRAARHGPCWSAFRSRRVEAAQLVTAQGGNLRTVWYCPCMH